MQTSKMPSVRRSAAIVSWLFISNFCFALADRDANVVINNEALIATSQEKVVKLYGAGGARGVASSAGASPSRVTI